MIASTEVERLETLWGGSFGNAYIERNRDGAPRRRPFWNELVTEFPFQTVLEIGCNIGANLECLQDFVPARSIWGIEVNETALQELRGQLPAVNAVWGVARELPFCDSQFDLCFTMGVLIHQPDESLLKVMGEVVRCSRQWILCAEYFAEDTVEVPYRGQSDALFKRDYGRIYREQFPQLRERKRGFLGRDAGFDDVTYWVFEKVDGPNRLP